MLPKDNCSKNEQMVKNELTMILITGKQIPERNGSTFLGGWLAGWSKIDSEAISVQLNLTGTGPKLGKRIVSLLKNC